jgi:hypothetical protein
MFSWPARSHWGPPGKLDVDESNCVSNQFLKQSGGGYSTIHLDARGGDARGDDSRGDDAHRLASATSRIILRDSNAGAKNPQIHLAQIYP